MPCIEKVAFLSELKQVNVVPFHKKKAKSDRTNCKPVSIFSNNNQ